VLSTTKIQLFFLAILEISCISDTFIIGLVGVSIYIILVFLVISCPCAFILSVPLAYFAGIGAFARNGILVKGADYIDALSKVKKIVF